ncbi:hypothetical protein PF005_g19756 [Phytophthora fragariae]|uniref:RxLR effector protein n=1 Tax=Phytophthora fragariae TaxID=53985 RepID=A0A6A3WTJ6_9STRA|nr:hypothetical protein PF003_g28061 [Phytophthora fragariae]KAE8934460.1 hypothetical protein PF009_g15560 [Phytophthora fragariae]KAE8989732.1 hypothetical protein PF011_g18642 [Phytophthora fragariae]KAE9102850.1 hypothetical protein PF007_g14602 [Phytophthora fragariae]KAE9103437.1 hypothetical protein PF010_g13730 [Phytophthora fragariae]
MISSNNFFALIVAVVTATSGVHTLKRNLRSSRVAMVRAVAWVAVSQASPRCQRLPPASRPTEDLFLFFLVPGALSDNNTDIDIDISPELCY